VFTIDHNQCSHTSHRKDCLNYEDKVTVKDRQYVSLHVKCCLVWC